MQSLIERLLFRHKFNAISFDARQFFFDLSGKYSWD